MIHILEAFCQGKAKNPALNEDGYRVTKDFAIVVDGMTSKSSHTWNNKTGGRLAMEILINAIDILPTQVSMKEAVEILTKSISKAYEENKILQLMQKQPLERWTASVAIFSEFRREIWLVGDCQCLIGDTPFKHEKKIDDILSNVRAFVLESEMIQGSSIENLLNRDIGRELIMPFLQREKEFQNIQDSIYAYEVFDGFPVRIDLVKIIEVPKDFSIIILASDGYPNLSGSLKETESELRKIINIDPLCFRENRSTKGIKKDQDNFDDRTYLKIKIE